ncbi:anti-sigma factor antagonist [Streptomyces globisporus]|uniref:Anti-sigma factor antagonist n=2 Tax=Streptomyces TaxID=1883 RepID=A0ABM9H8Q1_STRGL|nr:anti-sigma factor antagonist [Streptomyces globisporus]RDL05071.1 anti-anti-sigma factor [Streptomyces sp. HB202]CAH9420038.1 anti-sigma factor antagonist [Streptomyces globisporus]
MPLAPDEISRQGILTSMSTPERRQSSVPLAVIAPRGEFDLDSLPPLQGQIDTALADHAGVILDASGITFADSMFLRLLLTTHHRTDLRIAAPSETIERLLAVVGVDSVLRVFPTVDAAQSA